jgi:hypothetical protein
MSTRGSGRASRATRRATAAALGIVAALALGACGSKDFANEPRPPAPIEVTAKVDSSKVVVSPSKFGAGLVTFTIANLSDSPVRFTLSGPTDAASEEIQPGTPANLKVNLAEGDYQATAGSGVNVKPAKVTVGPERKSSQNKLLLP